MLRFQVGQCAAPCVHIGICAWSRLRPPPVYFVFETCVDAALATMSSPRERVLGTCVRPGVAEPDCEPVEG